MAKFHVMFRTVSGVTGWWVSHPDAPQQGFFAGKNLPLSEALEYARQGVEKVKKANG